MDFNKNKEQIIDFENSKMLKMKLPTILNKFLSNYYADHIDAEDDQTLPCLKSCNNIASTSSPSKDSQPQKHAYAYYDGNNNLTIICQLLVNYLKSDASPQVGFTKTIP